MSAYSLQGIDIPPEEFLRPFFDPKERVCLRVFSDRHDDAFSGQKFEVEQGRFDTIVNVLQEHNQLNRGIYFAINFGGHEDAEITRINAQFMECDNIPLEEQLVKIQAFPLEPSLIVKTRKSLHCYWLTKNAKVERFRHIQKRLIAQFGADPACVNESRVFRLPGFMHCKEEPVMVECIKFSPELRYTQKELEAVLPEIPEEADAPPPSPSPIKDRSTQKGLVLVGSRCVFIQYCKKNAKTLPEPIWYAMITNLAVFEGGETAIHKLSKPYPKYTFQATQAKIDHFHKSGTKPITCKKIAENGFVCPRMQNGSCTCKSPAGLAFRPMSVDELKKALSTQKVRHEAADDVQTVRRFIADHLFNVDPGVAEVFINNNIKQHFGLKTVDVKSLPAYQRELHRAFSSSQEMRQERRNDGIPKWFEISEKGKWCFLPGVLADHCTETEHVVYCADSYYFYDDGVYRPKNDKTAQRKIRSFMNSRYALASEIRDAEWQWQVLIDKTVREINVNPYIMNFSNGLYNLLTDEFSPHDPKILSTIRLGGKYDTDAKCPVFLNYLADVLPETEFELIQEILGYFLIALNKAQKSFVIVGKGDSGKSTFLNVVQDVLLGSENVSTLTWQALDEKFATVQLFGKLANIFADLPTENIKDTGTFKAITGEDYISAQHKFKDYFSFKPFARLLFSCNSIPKSYNDRTDGFYRRLILIRFDNAIPEAKRDPHLKEKLALEADGILAWAMIGLKRLVANSYRFSETERTKEEKDAYKRENSSVLSFVDEYCTVKPGCSSPSMDLFEAYQDYCHRRKNKPLSQGKFNKELEGIDGLIKTRDERRTKRIWMGIELSGHPRDDDD